VTRRGEALELAVLGLLHESPLHGYELRKRLTGVLGWGRVLSFGSLYPCLKNLLRDGLIAEDLPVLPADVRTSRRAKIVYKLTAEGKERFETLVSAAGPSAWDDDNFGVHFAFFDSANAETRIRILEGRRSRLEERIDNVRTAVTRSRERVNSYTLELQRHGLESVEREVRWLTELIDNERVGQSPSGVTDKPAAPAATTPDTKNTTTRSTGDPSPRANT
jgi:DNA-binding PadR family transcriptional regulator